MQNMGLVMEYESILLQKRKMFSSTYIKKGSTEADIKGLLQYVFLYLLNWEPDQIYYYITPELLQTLHLSRILQKVNYPTGIYDEIDLYYLACLVYPKQFKVSERTLTLKVYNKVLSGELAKFPKNFFLKANSEYRFGMCVQYAINQNMPDDSVESLYKFFSDTNKAIKFLKDVRLYAQFRDMYSLPLDMLHDILPKSNMNNTFYMYYKFKKECKEKAEKNRKIAKIKTKEKEEFNRYYSRFLRGMKTTVKAFPKDQRGRFSEDPDENIFEVFKKEVPA